MIALAVFTDGREHIFDTLASASKFLRGPITTKAIFDDSGNLDNTARLAATFAPLGFKVVGSGQRVGFSGAIRNAWDLLAQRDERFVFHLEDDFTFNRPVNLEAMGHVLDRRPYLVQMALRRQPWNPEECAAGGIVELHPDDYTDRCGIECYPAGEHIAWLEHRRFFTTNPSLYRRSLCARGWPRAEHSEGVFTHQLLAQPSVRFGFWGGRDSGEWVTHIGAERVGTGY